MSRDFRLYLEDILEAATRVRTYTSYDHGPKRLGVSTRRKTSGMPDHSSQRSRPCAMAGILRKVEAIDAGGIQPMGTP